MLHNMAIPFDTPKVTDLGKEHIASFTDKDSLVFDFFAGSGTYGHSVIKLNKEDGGHRKFILCDMADYLKRTKASHRKSNLFRGLEGWQACFP